MEFHERSNDLVRAELGTRLRAVRKSRGLNQTQLAERSGLSRPTVSTLERGNEVGLDSFLCILRALDLIDALDAAVPVPGISPMAELTGRAVGGAPRTTVSPGWSWGDEVDDAP